MEDDNKTHVPPPASSIPLPEGMQGQLPLPVGSPMILNNPLEGERAVLEKVGWKEGDPVPENFAEIAEIAKTMASDDNLTPPVDPRTSPLDTPEEVSIDSLPQEDQDKYYDILRSALSHAREVASQPQPVADAPEGLNEAIQEATGPGGLSLEDDTDSDTYSTGEPKTPPQDDIARAGDPLCPQCGWDSRDGNPIEVTDSDKTNFLQALLGQVQFYKEYTLFGGNIRVMVRTLKPKEVDECFRQVMLDIRAGRIFTKADEAETLLRYRSALQVISVTSSAAATDKPDGIDISFSRSLDEWTIEEDVQRELSEAGDNKIRGVWDKFQVQLDSSETMHRLIIGTVARFNITVARLEVNSNNPDFWKAIGSDS